MSESRQFRLSDIERVYFCAGARNHKLKNMFKSSALCFELDERSAAFKALGSSKAGKLSAICVTSGTAVAQCLPAMIEAYYSNTPFILISADRPLRLRGTGAAQTIEHFAVTSGYAQAQVELVDTHAKDTCFELGASPMHINILVDEDHTRENQVKKAAEGALQTFLNTYERTLFLISHDTFSLREITQELLSKTRLLYAETLSGAKDLSPIANEFELLALYREGAFDSIVRIGHTPLSKLWRIIDTKEIPVFSLDPRGLSGLSHGELSDLGYEVLKDLEIKPVEFESRFSWEALKRFPNSQMSILKQWQESAQENSFVYLGNSSVIRDFEAVQTKAFRIFGNRGANGIDGQLSTAIGMANELDAKLTCFLGDLTFMYDLSAAFDLPKTLEVVVLDNQGGRIFERIGINDEILLPQAARFKQLPLGDQIKILTVCPEQTIACFRALGEEGR